MDFVPPTEEEKAQVELLRARLVDESVGFEFCNTSILRFLRGRKGDVDKAFRALVRHVQWRIEHDVENIHPDLFREELESGKIIVQGHDKRGRPLVTVFPRKHRKDSRDIEIMRKFIIYTLETAIESSNPEEQKMTIVFDLNGFGMFCMDYEVLKMLIEILQFNYPETLAGALVVSAPFLFSACWVIIRPWLDPVTASKCHFLSHSQLKDHVEEHMIHPEIAK